MRREGNSGLWLSLLEQAADATGFTAEYSERLAILLSVNYADTVVHDLRPDTYCVLQMPFNHDLEIE